MKYLWTEDRGAGFHFWKLVNQHVFQGQMVVESKLSNQGLLDAIRGLRPEPDDMYYIAFDIVYDNMDIVNKLLELQQLISKYPEQIVLLDVTCFEYIILSFSHLIEWTGTGKKGKIEMRKHILSALNNHKIELEKIENRKTLDYLMGFKRFSTERVLKAITYELTDSDVWSVKGDSMGECWCQDCCVLVKPKKSHCGLGNMSGTEKIDILLKDEEANRIISRISAAECYNTHNHWKIKNRRKRV